LAVVINLLSREVAGLSMNNSLEKKSVLDALTMSLWRRKPKDKIIIRSDKVCQFESEEFNQWC